MKKTLGINVMGEADYAVVCQIIRPEEIIPDEMDDDYISVRQYCQTLAKRGLIAPSSEGSQNTMLAIFNYRYASQSTLETEWDNPYGIDPAKFLKQLKASQRCEIEVTGPFKDVVATGCTVIERRCKEGMVPALQLSSLCPQSGWNISPILNKLPIEGEFFHPIVGVYFQIDWLRALLNITIERRKVLLEAYENDPNEGSGTMRQYYSERFYATDDIRRRWRVAKFWPSWRRGRVAWKRMYEDLNLYYGMEDSIRTLQRTAKDLDLIKDW